jgi:hypothetical protein
MARGMALKVEVTINLDSAGEPGRESAREIRQSLVSEHALHLVRRNREQELKEAVAERLAHWDVS